MTTKLAGRFAIGAATALIGAAALSADAVASPFVVDAFANSSSGGLGVASVSVTAGETLNVSVAVTDLWNAGALPRWSNADGLIVNLFATGTDDFGEPAATHIGTPFALWTQAGLTAPYGSLVGEIGGIYKLLGTSFSGLAWANGTLNLYYWDSNFADNTQFITADVEVVPEPSTLFLLGAAVLSLLGLGRMRMRPQ